MFRSAQMDAKFVRNQRFARKGNVGVVEARARHAAKKAAQQTRPKPVKL